MEIRIGGGVVRVIGRRGVYSLVVPRWGEKGVLECLFTGS